MFYSSIKFVLLQVYLTPSVSSLSILQLVYEYIRAEETNMYETTYNIIRRTMHRYRKMQNIMIQSKI